MVTLKYNATRFFWVINVLIAGCTITSHQPATPVPVEDRTSPDKRSANEIDHTVKTYPAPAPESVPAPVPLPEQTGVESQVQLQVEQVPGPAVVALLDDADQYAASGKRDQAAASLERALRIEPKNPLLWHRLSLIRLQQGDWDQAIALATKSNVLAAGNNALQSDNWLVIAKAKDAVGDKAGAIKATEMAR
ncbi:MAG: tetratricopeptide repeat protein, partial [Gammaproteobacteria bacterium]|nr:tetratricopeptide repeat protein [Gammaproteobacteria bacterium]